MSSTSRPSARRRTFGALAAAALVTSSLAATAVAVDPVGDPADAPSPLFSRHDVDAVQGAAFTSVGEVFPGEKNIVTAGYGALKDGVPGEGGTLQVYRPGDNFTDWERTEVFGADEEVIFPNRPTIVDVDGDGLNDILLPSGYFFDTNPAKVGGAQQRSAITWWKNLGLDAKGNAKGFKRNNILTGIGESYHGVELVDLDGDGIRDIVTTAEAANAADVQTDDVVKLQYLRGLSATSWAAPVTLAEGLGGSHPHVADVDGDGDLDIISSQYFNLTYTAGDRAAFLWFERKNGSRGPLRATDFTPRTIAKVADVGFGFQIQAVPNFREPGQISWIATNHQGRCFVDRFLHIVIPGAINVPEMVMEFVPGDDITEPWEVVELSRPAERAADHPACEEKFNKPNSPVLIHPTDDITARSSAGQAAPGVFGYGDLDGDGDVDLAVSGDGDRRLFWIEQDAAYESGTVLHTLTGPEETFGQSGGAIVEDLDRDGKPEMIFSSFDESKVAIWSQSAGTGMPRSPIPAPPVVKPTVPTQPTTPAVTRVTTSLKVSGPARAKARTKNVWKVRLTGAKVKKSRTVTVRFKPRGNKHGFVVKKIRLTSGKGRVHTGKLNWAPRRPGTLTFRYAGGKVKSNVVEKSSSKKVAVRVRR